MCKSTANLLLEWLPLTYQGWKEMGGVRGLGLSADLEGWRQRVLWLRAQDVSATSSTTLPDLSDDTLLAT
jgi:hypothetical protein